MTKGDTTTMSTDKSGLSRSLAAVGTRPYTAKSLSHSGKQIGKTTDPYATRSEAVAAAFAAHPNCHRVSSSRILGMDIQFHRA